ncbi:hypothetical protein V502_10178, partial [Pseudogymnoascus sp. VKM F-4520 (FW-2644)]
MSLKLAPITEDDAPAISTLLIAAFKDDLYQRVEYQTEESLVELHKYETNKTISLIQDPTRVLQKVIDTVTGRTLSFGRLSTPSATANIDGDDNDEDDWPESCNKEMCVPYMAKMKEMKTEILGERPHYQLDLLATDPEYQGRGAGALLVRWAISYALAEKVPLYIDASQGPGVVLYQKLGFKLMKSFEIDIAVDGVDQKYLTCGLVFEPE